MRDELPIIFLHIPKTGGMTFSEILARQYARRAVLQIDGAGHDLGRMSEQRRRELRCLYGHMPFGIHAALARPAVYVTLLRNPVERIVSIYYYALRRPEWGLHRQIGGGALSLHDFAGSEIAAEFHDQQTRLLSGVQQPVGGAEALAVAKTNLDEHFALAGLTERFDEFLLLCRRRFGWKHIYHVQRNVNRHRPRIDEIDRATISLIEERNQLDAALCELARGRLDDHLRQYPTLARDLRRFRRINVQYQLARVLLTLPAGMLRAARAALPAAHLPPLR